MAALAEDWVVDSLNEWLHSPMWLVPVLSFVDEHCLAFNGEEECPLACSQIHSEYVALLDALLEDFAGRMSLGSTQLLDAVQMGAVTQHAFEQVVLADDFQHFREVMFRRNLQLEREAIEELQRQHSTAGSEASLPAAATATVAASSSSSLESDSEMLEVRQHLADSSCSLTLSNKRTESSAAVSGRKPRHWRASRHSETPQGSPRSSSSSTSSHRCRLRRSASNSRRSASSCRHIGGRNIRC